MKKEDSVLVDGAILGQISLDLKDWVLHLWQMPIMVCAPERTAFDMFTGLAVIYSLNQY